MSEKVDDSKGHRGSQGGTGQTRAPLFRGDLDKILQRH